MNYMRGLARTAMISYSIYVCEFNRRLHGFN